MAIIKRNKSTIFGLSAELQAITQSVTTEVEAREAADGDLSLLETTSQKDLVTALNEVNTSATATADAALTKADNLASVEDSSAARTNLDVMSTTETTDAITAAQMALGTNHTVADITERDLLEDLTVDDRVFVINDGDGKWANYKPGTVPPEGGPVSSWIQLTDQDALENAISAPAIKSAYETNDDTNAYNDAAKAKVDLVSVTAAIDLDDAVLKADLVQDLEISDADDAAPSVAAVKAYATSAVAEGGALPVLEQLVVAGDSITLTHEPRGGVSGIMNFATVRYVDESSNAWDAPVTAGVGANEFVIAVDVPSEWDGKTVSVQYFH